MTQGILNNAQQGIQTGLRQTQSVANNIANLSTQDDRPPVDIPTEMVILMQADHQIAASLQVMSHADKALSALIEQLA